MICLFTSILYNCIASQTLFTMSSVVSQEQVNKRLADIERLFENNELIDACLKLNLFLNDIRLIPDYKIQFHKGVEIYYVAVIKIFNNKKVYLNSDVKPVFDKNNIYSCLLYCALFHDSVDASVFHVSNEEFEDMKLKYVDPLLLSFCLGDYSEAYRSAGIAVFAPGCIIDQMYIYQHDKDADAIKNLYEQMVERYPYGYLVQYMLEVSPVNQFLIKCVREYIDDTVTQLANNNDSLTKTNKEMTDANCYAYSSIENHKMLIQAQRTKQEMVVQIQSSTISALREADTAHKNEIAQLH